MAYQLRLNETPEDVAWELLGDRRLTHQLTIQRGYAYVKGVERGGKPARWAAENAGLEHLKAQRTDTPSMMGQIDASALR
jgi:hypothetical protein